MCAPSLVVWLSIPCRRILEIELLFFPALFFGAMTCAWLQVWQCKRLCMRRQLNSWRAAVKKRRATHVSAPAVAPISQHTPADNIIPSSTTSAAAASPSPSFLLKYFNAWFKFANVSQWSRDLQSEHDFARLKSAWAMWGGALASRRPRPPLSPASFAAAGVKTLMPRSPQAPLRSTASAQPSDVTVSIDFLDPDSPTPALSTTQRPNSRRLVSPDDSARLMFFFGPIHPPPPPPLPPPPSPLPPPPRPRSCCSWSLHIPHILHFHQECSSRRPLCSSFGTCEMSPKWGCGDATQCSESCTTHAQQFDSRFRLLLSRFALLAQAVIGKMQRRSSAI